MHVLHQLKKLLIDLKPQNEFDPTAWQDPLTNRLTAFTYLSCGFHDMNDCLLWTTWRLIRGEPTVNTSFLVSHGNHDRTDKLLGHCKLQLALTAVNALSTSTFCSACTICNHPMRHLERLLRARSPGKGRTLLRVLRWVAYSLRPLELHELFVAISTNTELDKGAAIARKGNTESHLGTQEDLFAFCDGLIDCSDQGTIRFVHASVKDFLQSPAMRALDPWEDNQVHEMMAVVCLRHVTCVDETAVLRPWASAAKELREPSSRCDLRDYSVLHWHQHFRLAESTSMYLPSLLYQALQAAFRKLDSKFGIAEGIVEVERRIDQGLQFCCRHDFLEVGKMFLEMSARTNTGRISAIQIAAEAGSIKFLEFLIKSGLKSNGYEEELFQTCWMGGAYSPLNLAAYHGRTAVVEFLLLGTSIYRTPKSNWETGFVIAVEYGHQEAVRTFLKSRTHLGEMQELVYRAMCLARDLEHDGIFELISTYRSVIYSDLNPHDHAVHKHCTPPIFTDFKSPQDMVTQTLDPGLRNLDLGLRRPAIVDVEDLKVIDVDINGSDELGDWSLVKHSDTDAIVEADMDMDHG